MGGLATDMLIEKGLADRLILITRTPAKLADRAAQGMRHALWRL